MHSVDFNDCMLNVFIFKNGVEMLENFGKQLFANSKILIRR